MLLLRAIDIVEFERLYLPNKVVNNSMKLGYYSNLRDDEEEKQYPQMTQGSHLLKQRKASSAS